MKTYNVAVDYKGDFTSCFQVCAKTLREAKEIASSHRRLEKIKGKVIVKLQTK